MRVGDVLFINRLTSRGSLMNVSNKSRTIWKDGERSWTTLRDIKESNAVDVADYVISNGLEK